MDRYVTEADWQRTIVELARLNGWLVFHDRVAWRSDPGWPDLVLLRGPRLVVAELKSETGKLTPAQEAWLMRWRSVPCAEVFVLRPHDWDLIVRVLSG